jgi:molybdenum cofactor cytidylyltransferase
MIFGRFPLAQARGGILAHSLKTTDRVLRKGALIDDAVYIILEQAGYTEVTVARLQPGDIPEGEAALRLGQALLADGLHRSGDVHGRVNLFASRRGLLRVNAGKIEKLNLVDEAISLATLNDRSLVEAGDMVATLKIIPFAVSEKILDVAEALIGESSPAFTLKPFQPLMVGLIVTRLPQLKHAAIKHTIEATEFRVSAHGGTFLPPRIIPHNTAAIRDAIRGFIAQNADLILISGASAVTDRQDIAPQGIVEAGGRITRFGMPVDPGNLICFGTVERRPIIILPGCARSPKPNGIDSVLDRVFAGEDVGPSQIAKMGIGGLLKELDSRPAPRLAGAAAGFGATPQALPRIAALVLAAGISRRMGPQNKLLAPLSDGRTLIARTVDNALLSAANPVIVITGHQDAAVRDALADKPVRFVYAADYQEGMAASLRAGIASLSEKIGGAVICLGDMPLVDAKVLDNIIATYNRAEGREIILPTFDGQRGNPVLWGKRFFPDLLTLTGDNGARQILDNYMEFVAEVPVENDSVLRDFDTPGSLLTIEK